MIRSCKSIMHYVQLTNLIAYYAPTLPSKRPIVAVVVEVSLSLAAVINVKLNANSLNNFSNCGERSSPSFYLSMIMIIIIFSFFSHFYAVYALLLTET